MSTAVMSVEEGRDRNAGVASGPDVSRQEQVASLAMVAAAWGMVEAAFAARDAQSPWLWLQPVALVAVAWRLRKGPAASPARDLHRTHRPVRPPRSVERSPSIATSVTFLAAFALPLVLHGVAYARGIEVATLEVSLLASLRNLMLLLALAFTTDAPRRLAVTASLFLAIYGFSCHPQSPNTWLGAGYGAAGCGWLLATQAARLRRHAHRSRVVTQANAAAAPRRSFAALLAAVVVLLAVLLATAVGSPSRSVARVLRGWLPSSGGEGWHDPGGWGGRGDGDQLMLARQQADSFGAVESELMLESKETSLYDMFNDMYGEVRPMRRDRVKSIPLAPQDSRTNHSMESRTESGGREFSVVRESPHQRRDALADRRAEAMLYVDGPTPLHLKLEQFDAWDGTRLIAHPAPPPGRLRLSGAEGLTWVTWDTPLPPPIDVPTDACFLEEETAHTLRVVRLPSTTIPAPAQLSRIRVDKIHTAHLFAWNENGLLRYAGDRIPSLSVLQIRSRRATTDRLERQAFRPEDHGSPADSTSRPPASSTTAATSPDDQPVSLDPAVRELVRGWTADATSDWQFVQAVITGLRRHATLDRQQSLAADSSDAVGDFLLRHRRGPDYLFALSAALLLRHHQFDTRVVSGLYAPPASRLRAAGRTPVSRDDLHFWMEVRTAAGAWIPCDPSPGYLVDYECRTLAERCRDTARAAWRHLSDHRRAWMSITGLLAATLTHRRRVSQLVDCLAWRAGRRDHARQRVLRTLQFVDRTAARQGQPRPPGVSLEQWLERLPLAGNDPHASRRDLVRLCQWAAYSSRPTPPVNAERLDRLCRSLALPHASLHAILRFDSCQPAPVDNQPVNNQPLGELAHAS